MRLHNNLQYMTSVARSIFSGLEEITCAEVLHNSLCYSIKWINVILNETFTTQGGEIINLHTYCINPTKLKGTGNF